MAACRCLLRSRSLAGTPSRISNSFFAKTLSSTSTSTTLPSHHNDHERNHEYRQPNRLVNSWKPAKDPKESQARLAQLRREYAKQVKELRKEYSHEMQLQMMEKQRKDEAKREASRIAREERKAAKAAAAEARAAERKVSEEEFRQTLLKERAEKLENWRMKEKLREQKKAEGDDMLRRKSSMWVDEPDLEKTIVDAIVNTTGR